MRLNVSAWSIRRPVPAIVLFAVLMLLGVMSFMTLPVTRFPNIDVPIISATITQSGAAPEELETQITKEIEDAVANITGVKHIQSVLTDGASTTVLEFRLETDTDRALNDVKDAIAKKRAALPRTIDEPIIERIDVEGQAILSFAASSPGMTLEQISWHVDDVIKRRLQALKGVGRVERYGGVTREIRVHLDPDKLLAYGVTAADINRQLRATNVDLGSGRGEVGGQEQAIRTLAGAREVEALADSRIILPGGREVRLRDLGRVVDDASEQRSFGRLDGQPVVSFSIFRSKGSSELSVADVVVAALSELEREHPDVHLTKIDDAVSYTRGNYEAAMAALLEGALLAVLVVLVFLRNWRATLIAAIALPLSAIPTFWAISAMGFSLNLVSLLGITLVTGILVDDAIVEIENIVRHMNMGKSPYRASLEAADEIGLAVMAITLTIVAIFAPVSFMGGIAGQYFQQFGLTVAVAVLFSLLVARLITPMMAAYLMKPIPETTHGDGFVMRTYLAFLRLTLRWRYVTLLAGVTIFSASIYATALLPTGFIPDEDTSRVVASVELPPGTPLAETAAKTDEMVRALKTIPEIKHVFVLGGTSPTGQLEVRRAALFITLVPKTERSLSQKQLQTVISAKLADVPDSRAWYVNERGEREMSFSMLSRSGDDLNTAIGQLEGALRQVPGFRNVAASGSTDRPEIRIIPRLDEAARLGVSPEQIAETIRVATIGDAEFNLAKYTVGDRQIPIRVQLEETTRTDLARLEQLRVTSTSGVAVPLTAVATIAFGRGPASIERYDRERRAVIGVDLESGVPLSVGRERFLEVVAAQSLPASVRLQPSGDAEIQDEVANGFITAMGTGLMIVLGVLVLLFGSVFQPITILLSLPLSFGGVVVALIATNNPISMPVYIGLLMLMGIVTKNAILLVDFAIEEIARGVDRNTAIFEAGRKRARPIVMTTLAMASGMLPSALALGDGGEFRAPMAIAVIGGLLVSTVLSLIFVPSFFTVMDDLGHVMQRIFGRFIGPTDEPDAALTAVPAHGGPAPISPPAPGAQTSKLPFAAE
jgi:hydrophobic/amphiphilic exporter-1 (mainly G- bacteria), HAE1 family